MNGIRIALAAVLLVGVTAFSYSQDPARETKPSQQENPKPHKPEKPEEGKAQKPEKQENPNVPKESAKPGHEMKNEQGHARPAGKSAHIPDPKFKANFGRPHTFTVNKVINQKTIVAGQTQFVYSGYTFIILDPWPAEWLFTDDCYIDFIGDEYVLVNVFHPGVYVSLFVVA
jgi:hypothetical protein